MNFKKEYQIDGFVLNKQNILELFDLSKDYSEDSLLDINFKDSSSLIDLSKTEFQNHNYDGKIIEKVSLHFSKFENHKKESSLFFYLSTKSIFITIESTDEKCYCTLKNRVDSWIESLKKRNCLALKIVNHDLFFIIFGGIVFTALLVYPVYRLYEYFNINSSVILTIFCIFLPPICFGLSALLEVFISKLYPIIEIDIRNNKAKLLRKRFWWVFSVILVPFVFFVLSLCWK